MTNIFKDATKEQIIKWLEQHTTFNRGYDIQEGPFPLPASIGEGFTFQLEDFKTKKMLDFIAEADRNDGKRVLRFTMSTFIGLCDDACHYFCTAHSDIHWHEVGNPNHIIAGYLGGIERPRESENLVFNLGIPLTEAMIEEDSGHYSYNNPGDCGTALRDKDQFFTIIKELENIFNMDEWTFVVCDNTYN